MTNTDPTYGYTAHLPGVSFDEARARITEALKAQGFGILTEIDVTATLEAKLDQDFRRYVILGACNPRLAFKALSKSACLVLARSRGAQAHRAPARVSSACPRGCRARPLSPPTSFSGHRCLRPTRR